MCVPTVPNPASQMPISPPRSGIAQVWFGRQRNARTGVSHASRPGQGVARESELNEIKRVLFLDTRACRTGSGEHMERVTTPVGGSRGPRGGHQSRPTGRGEDATHGDITTHRHSASKNLRCAADRRACCGQAKPAPHPYRAEDSRILGYSHRYFGTATRQAAHRPARTATRRRGIASGRADPPGAPSQRVASASWRDFSANEILV
ncbi:hypothetical protein GCM10023319_04810 [Nocardia iowensis]